MKHGRNPTLAQREVIAAFERIGGEHLNPNEWLVIKNLPFKLVLRHRECKITQDIPVKRRH
jgi:hypothetical protein